MKGIVCRSDIQLNPVHTDTKGAIESVCIKWAILFIHLLFEQNTREIRQNTSIVKTSLTVIKPLFCGLSIKTLKSPEKSLIIHFIIKTCSLHNSFDVKIVYKIDVHNKSYLVPYCSARNIDMISTEGFIIKKERFITAHECQH